MNYLYTAFLGFVQGVAEFLPISSSCCRTSLACSPLRNPTCFWMWCSTWAR